MLQSIYKNINDYLDSILNDKRLSDKLNMCEMEKLFDKIFEIKEILSEKNRIWTNPNQRIAAIIVW